MQKLIFGHSGSVPFAHGSKRAGAGGGGGVGEEGSIRKTGKLTDQVCFLFICSFFFFFNGVGENTCAEGY